MLDNLSSYIILVSTYSEGQQIGLIWNGTQPAFCPWAFFVGKYPEGIVLLKDGALMRTYPFVCPDLGSVSAESINAV
jgi:hypothetical protein